MVFLYVFQPLFERITAIRQQKALSAVVGVVLILFLTDAATTFLR